MKQISTPILFAKSETERTWADAINAWPVVLWFTVTSLPLSWQTLVISEDYLGIVLIILLPITAISWSRMQFYLNTDLEVVKQGIGIKQQGILYKLAGQSFETVIGWEAIKGVTLDKHGVTKLLHSSYKIVLKTSPEQEYCLYFYNYWFSGKKKHLHNFIDQLENFREGRELARSLRFKLGQL